MSRTTTALKRLAVPGLAAVTLIAGIPVLAATSASAAAGDTITISPTADSASAGTCNPFTVTVKNSAGQPATSTVDVVITQRNNGAATAADTFDVTFCTTNTTTPNQAPTNQGQSGTPTGIAPTGNTDTDTRRGEFTPNAQGTFTFGVQGTEPGVADIVAYLDNDNDNTIDTGENFATATKTFTAGTAADVRTITATPETATKFVGETHTISAVLKNAAGDTVAGVAPVADVTSGPNAAVTPNCTASDNDGVSKCTYIGGAVGTDTVVVFLNQTNADGNPSTPDTSGPDAGEPQDTVQVTWQTAPTGLTIDLTCGDASTPRSGPEDCFNPLSDNTEAFSALVKRADGSVASGVIVSFAVTGDTVADSSTDAKPTLSAAEATTDASGIATVTLTDPQPKNPETVTVTATIRGQSPTTSDDARKTWRTTTTGERVVTLTPETASTVVNTFRTFTARVVNVNGEPVSGADVRFDETGAGAFRNGSSTVFAVTDSNGNATVEVTASSVEAGQSQTITATISGAECSKLAGDPAGSTAGDCADSSTNSWTATGASASPSASASPTSSATPGPTGSPSCAVTPTVTLEFGTINATGSSGVTVNAPANSQIQLFAYSQPSTTYRVVRQATIDNTGTPAQFRITPPTNTRLYAQIVGCTTNPTTASKVLNVRTTLSLNVTRTGVRAYRFFGDSLPARPGGLIVSLYRVTDSGQQILTAQTRASASTGDWVINRVFTGTGRFGFVVRTGQDLQNAPGASNVRSLLIF